MHTLLHPLLHAKLSTRPKGVDELDIEGTFLDAIHLFASRCCVNVK